MPELVIWRDEDRRAHTDLDKAPATVRISRQLLEVADSIVLTVYGDVVTMRFAEGTLTYRITDADVSTDLLTCELLSTEPARSEPA